jgi:hypothetical protein
MTWILSQTYHLDRVKMGFLLFFEYKFKISHFYRVGLLLSDFYILVLAKNNRSSCLHSSVVFLHEVILAYHGNIQNKIYGLYPTVATKISELSHRQNFSTHLQCYIRLSSNSIFNAIRWVCYCSRWQGHSLNGVSIASNSYVYLWTVTLCKLRIYQTTLCHIQEDSNIKFET